MQTLYVVIAVLTGIIVAQVAGILAKLSGSDLAGSLGKAGVAFAAAVTLMLMIMSSLGVL